MYNRSQIHHSLLCLKYPCQLFRHEHFENDCHLLDVAPISLFYRFLVCFSNRQKLWTTALTTISYNSLFTALTVADEVICIWMGSRVPYPSSGWTSWGGQRVQTGGLGTTQDTLESICLTTGQTRDEHWSIWHARGTGFWGWIEGPLIGQSPRDMGGQSSILIGQEKLRISCLRNCRISVCDKIFGWRTN